jgi:hypothetical protein
MEQSFLHLSVISEFGVISVIQTLVERKNVEAKMSKGKMSKVEMCDIFKKLLGWQLSLCVFFEIVLEHSRKF